MDTVWDANSMIRIAGQNEPRYLAGHGLKVCHPLHMSKMILRHGVRMATDTEVEWAPGNTNEVAEILEHSMLQGVVGKIVVGLL
jgi:hypothetical protein